MFLLQVTPQIGVQAQSGSIPPALPTPYNPTTPVITNTVNIASTATSADLQNAFDNALPGTEIVIPANKTFNAPSGGFVLGGKPGSGWIVIRTANTAGIPAANTRATRSHAAAMPNIMSTDVDPAIVLKAATSVSSGNEAHHYRFIGIEFGITASVTLNYAVVRVGEFGPTSSAMQPHDIVFDHCYVHGSVLAHAKRGIEMNSGSTAVLDSYISDFHGIGQEAQAIGGWNGPGPYKLINNYLEGAGENVLFGGGEPTINNIIPSDMEIRHNHFYKPPAWKNSIITKPAGVNATATTGGTLSPSTTYYYVLTASGAAGATTATSSPSVEDSVALTSTQNAVNVVWNRVTYSGRHAASYRIYRTNDAPGGARNWTYYTYTPPDPTAATFSYTDTGSAGTTGSAPPTIGTRWTVKNLFELKDGQRVLLDGNIFENCWADAQGGTAILLHTAADDDGVCTWCVVKDITFTNNIVRHAGGGVSFQANDWIHPTGTGRGSRFKVANNLLSDITSSTWGGNGWLFRIASGGAEPGPDDLQIIHNTAFQSGRVIDTGDQNTDKLRFTYKDNIQPHNADGVIGEGTTTGNQTLTDYFPGAVFTKNVLMTPDASVPPKYNLYPGNLFPASWNEVMFVDKAGGNYRLVACDPNNPGTPCSPYWHAGSDGKDIGADIDALDEATMGVTTGVYTPGQTDLPSPWMNQDVGSVGIPGSASYANGAFTIDGSGADIWGTADEFHFVYMPAAAYTSIQARVTAVENTNPFAKVGVMMRETLNANSRHVILDVKPDGGLEFSLRGSTGGNTVFRAGATAAVPYWIKLERSGTTFSAFKSSDGINWVLIARTSVTMASNFYVGLAVSSHDDTMLCTGELDNVLAQ
jgi:hypothetical protein